MCMFVWNSYAKQMGESHTFHIKIFTFLFLEPLQFLATLYFKVYLVLKCINYNVTSNIN